MATNLFGSYGHYYDLLYRDKDYTAEVAYIELLLNRYGIGRGNLLEFGSGTGKHGCLLAAKGYIVHGIELSAEMVSFAQTPFGFTCQQGDIAQVNMKRKYDAVLSLFHTISYQTRNDQLKAVLCNAASHLNSGGIFIFDFWYSPAVWAQKPVVRVKRMRDNQIEIVRIAEPLIFPNENRVDVNYTIYARNLKSDSVEAISESHPMRHFSLPEIEILAQNNGFELVNQEEFLTGDVPSESTWGVCVILQKT
jgi:SAM-dependent methyltransferase